MLAAQVPEGTHDADANLPSRHARRNRRGRCTHGDPGRAQHRPDRTLRLGSDPPAVGTQLAIEDLNAAGGVLGEPLRLVTVDDGCDPEQAPLAARKLVSDGVAVTFSGTGWAPRSLQHRSTERPGSSCSSRRPPTRGSPTRVTQACSASSAATTSGRSRGRPPGRPLGGREDRHRPRRPTIRKLPRCAPGLKGMDRQGRDMLPPGRDGVAGNGAWATLPGGVETGYGISIARLLAGGPVQRRRRVPPANARQPHM